ncbi:hypothetical protein TWF694_008600 [Orbilia ellipsospora]|uniref:Uncharacterized protein n=1 Tax=Orbilia ellipsospora TaxID=2528407 RepID=A0AAV9XNA3_9PEZI
MAVPLRFESLDVHTLSGWKPYQNVQFDSMKLYTKAQGTKTQNLIINLDNPEWMFDDDSKTLAEVGCGISFPDRPFKMAFTHRSLFLSINLDADNSTTRA